MSAPMKNGKESIKNRYEVLKEVSYNEQDKFSLTDKQKAYLKTNDLSHRFIREKEYAVNNNFHKSGWIVIPDPDMPGANAEGLVKIGDLVMAVKTNEAQAAHRARIKARTDRTNPTRMEADAAKELREHARKISKSSVIYEGYEKNSPSEKDDD